MHMACVPQPVTSLSRAEGCRVSSLLASDCSFKNGWEGLGPEEYPDVHQTLQLH
jgi:hypothetical protein